MHDARNTFENNKEPPFGHPSPGLHCRLFLNGFSNRPPNRDAPESTAPRKSRKPKTFNTSCCASILIYSTLIQAPRKLQAFNNSAPQFFPPSLALPYWSLVGFRPLLSQVFIFFKLLLYASAPVVNDLAFRF